MSKILPRYIFGVVLISVFGYCTSYGEIKVRRDSFKNSKITTVMLDHTSEEKFGMFGSHMPITVTYTKEQKSGQEPIIELKFVTPASATSQLKPQAFIKADKEKFELKFEGITKATAVESKTENTIDEAGKLLDSKTKTSTQYGNIATLSVPWTIWQTMMKAKRFGYRIYMDQEPISFLVSEEWHEKLREFDSQ